MDSIHSPEDSDFLEKLTEIIEANLTNSQFGVSMLARELNMSRSNLHRKVSAVAKISVSQFINQMRLKQARKLLAHTSDTVTDVAYQVGFHNVSYFIKCFHTYYGYSPGAVGRRFEDASNTVSHRGFNKKWLTISLVSAAILLVSATVLFLVIKPFPSRGHSPEKSIAILPPIYILSDSSKCFFIDGIAETLYSKLALIKDLTVIPWTSVRKFRNTEKGIPEIMKDLKVEYIVETIGQVYDNDNFRITVTLINSKHRILWSERYEEILENIFIVEDEISNNIAMHIGAKITPEERLRINKRPTDNNLAYENYLRGGELLNQEKYTYLGGSEYDYWDSINLGSIILINRENYDASFILNYQEDLLNAKNYFLEALKHDERFALVYAELARIYYYLDCLHGEKMYSSQIYENAEMAMLYDPQLDKSYIAKALYYRYQKDFELAIKWMEQALEVNPNSYLAMFFLRGLYRWSPVVNPEQYLNYALKALKLNMTSTDSINKSYDYAILGAACRLTGFFHEAEKYLDLSLEINPDNQYASAEKAELFQDMEKGYQQRIDYLLSVYNKDTSNISILRCLFLIYYFMGDFENALKYYYIRSENKAIVDQDAGRVAFMFSKSGKKDLSEEYLDIYFNHCENILTPYVKYQRLSAGYSFIDDTPKALEQMRLLLEQGNYSYWVIYDYKYDHLYDNIRDLQEFQELLTETESKFWENHNRIRASLEKDGLL